jgi:hypothetical protein
MKERVSFGEKLARGRRIWLQAVDKFATIRTLSLRVSQVRTSRSVKKGFNLFSLAIPLRTPQNHQFSPICQVRNKFVKQIALDPALVYLCAVF